MTRQAANKLILDILSKYVEDSPDIRFHQMLINLDVNLQTLKLDKNGMPEGGMDGIDQYAEESVKTLERILLK
jgi:hypothetical protein